MNSITLITPTATHAGAVMDYRREMLQYGSDFDGCAGLEETDSFEQWLDFEGRLSAKYGEGYVPSRVYLAMAGDRLVGMIDLRQQLSEFLYKYGGSIGYSVRPTERGKGYANEMLHLLLDICREMGEEKLLFCCDPENVPSRRTIIRNGGVLENEVPDDPGLTKSGIIQRYWIKL